MIYILGIKGNMGRRYAACLKSLGIEVIGSDVGEIPKPPADIFALKGIINATPTDRHIDTTEDLLSWQVPILVEKPFARSYEKVLAFEKKYKKVDLNLITMVNQYYFMPGLPIGNKKTWYDFYHSGNDGLHWDAINLIGMAEGDIELLNESPIWKCGLNGRSFSKGDIDNSYVKMISYWLIHKTLPKGNWEYIRQSTRKVEEWLKS